MICDKCYHRCNCEELPDKNGRCNEYLKDGEIIVDEEMKLNPTDTIDNYDRPKNSLKIKSSKLCASNIS